MLLKTKLRIIVVLALVIGGLFSVSIYKSSIVTAAPAGTCQYISQTSQRGDPPVTQTKACTEFANKFAQAATDAAAANNCYVYLNNLGPNNTTTISVDERACGSDSPGTCTDQFTSGNRGDNNSTKKPCPELALKFANAANQAASSRKCYILNDNLAPNSNTRRVVLRISGCGSSDSTTIGGTEFEENKDTNIPGITREADRAFGGCASSDIGNDCNLIDKYLNPAINLLSAAAGMAIVIMIIVGGIQYASAGGDPGKVAAAKGRIINALVAIVAFFFLYAVLQWLVPGGLF